MVEAVKSVATPDDHTAVITLNQPNTAFLSYLASPFGPKMESPDGPEGQRRRRRRPDLSVHHTTWAPGRTC